MNKSNFVFGIICFAIAGIFFLCDFPAGSIPSSGVGLAVLIDGAVDAIKDTLEKIAKKG